MNFKPKILVLKPEPHGLPYQGQWPNSYTTEYAKTLTNTVETLLGFCANVASLRLRVRAFLAPSNPPLPLQLLHKIG
jgi:hypothetical protein